MRTIYIPTVDQLSLIYTNQATGINTQAYVDMATYQATVTMNNKYLNTLKQIANLQQTVVTEINGEPNNIYQRLAQAAVNS